MDRKAILEAKKAKLQELRRQRAEKESEGKQKINSSSFSPSVSPFSTYFKSGDQSVDNLVSEILAGPENTKENEGRSEEAILDSQEDSLNVRSAVIENSLDIKHSKKEVIMYDKGVDTNDELIDHSKIELEEIKASLEKELRRKIENELREKMEKEFCLKLEKTLREEDLRKQEKAATEMKTHQELDKLLGNEDDGDVENGTENDGKLPDSSNAAHDIQENGTLSGKNKNFNSVYASPMNNDVTFKIDKLLFLEKTFMDDDLLSGRSIAYIDCSPYFPELVLASYTASNNHKLSKGVVVVWNIKTKLKEFILLSNTEITVAQFALHASNIVFGGGYNGKCYMWDFTSKSRYPTSQTSYGSSLKTDPIVALHQTYNAHMYSANGKSGADADNATMSSINEKTTGLPNHNIGGSLISLSATGSVNYWSIYLVSQSLQPAIDISIPKEFHGSGNELATTAMTILPGGVNSGYILAGDITGSVYRVRSFDSKDGKAGVDTNFMYVSTSSTIGGMVTKLAGRNKPSSVNPVLVANSSNTSLAGLSLELDKLFLTASLDFSIRLYKLSENPRLINEKQFKKNKKNFFGFKTDNDDLVNHNGTINNGMGEKREVDDEFKIYQDDDEIDDNDGEDDDDDDDDVGNGNIGGGNTKTEYEFSDNLNSTGTSSLTSNTFNSGVTNQKQIPKALPLLSIRTTGFVMDIAWRPNYISQFASVDNNGDVLVWDILKDTLDPIMKININEVYMDHLTEKSDDYDANDLVDQKIANASGKYTDGIKSESLNKVCWNNDGSHLTVGGVSGRIYIFKCVNDLVAHDSLDTYINFKTNFNL